MLKSMSLACGAVLLFGCAPPFDPQAEGKKLLTRDAEWADAASAGRDVDKTVSYWSEDAVIIPQGQKTIEGRAAIRAFVDGSFHTPGFHIHWTSEKPLFSPDGKFAYLRSTTETTVPGPNGTTVTFPSRGLTVWRVDLDGEWRCVVDIWNDPPPQAHASVKAG
jgi:ketosteroid isomerase-like protein